MTTPHLPQPLATPVYFLSYEFDYSRYLVLSRSMQYLPFCDWLISLSIMFSRFIRIVMCVKIPFLLKSESYSTVGIRPHCVYPVIGWWPFGLLLHFDFPGGSDGKSFCLQCERPGFSPWFGKIPWRRKWQPAPVLLPWKSHGQRSLVQATIHGVAKSRAWRSDFTSLHLTSVF